MQQITRMSKHDTWLNVAFDIAQRGTCIRRSVGCVLLDIHGRVLSTGYNGPASGDPHCIDHPCAGASAQTGASLGLCESIHAEENALLQCKDDQKIHTAYCVASPCLDRCLRKFKGTSTMEIVFVYGYHDPDEVAKRSWEASRPGRKWTQVNLDTRTWLPLHDDMPGGFYYMRSETDKRGSEEIVQLYGHPRRDPSRYAGKVFQRIQQPTFERRRDV